MSAPRDGNGHVAIDYFAEIQRRNSEAASVQGEVRMVARMETNAQRTVYLERVIESRGMESAAALRRQVFAYMQANGIRHDEPQQEALFG